MITLKERRELRALTDRLENGYFQQLSGLDDLAAALSFLLRRELERSEQ